MKRQKNLIVLWLSACMLLMLLAACSATAPTTPSNGSALSSLATIGTATIAPTTAPNTAATLASTTAASTTSLATVTSAPAIATATATTAAAPTATATQPAATATPITSSNAGAISNIIYKTDKGLYAYNIATGKSFELAQGNIFHFVVSPDNRRVAFLTANGNNLALNMVTMHGNSASDPKIMDSKVGSYTAATEDNPFAGRYMVAYTLAFSPDSNLVAYTKDNANGQTFDMWEIQTKPTEVWLGEVQSYNVRRLAPNNDKDFMYEVAFSTDGARVGFLRTTNFPSDVSGTVALWSVHTDGTKLTILQDGGALSQQAGTAGAAGDPLVGRIGEFHWTNPLGVTFTIAGLTGSSTWVHDLNTGKARQLYGGSYEQYQYSRYDAISRRYAFTSDKGLFTIGTANAQDKPVQVATKVKRLVNFRDNSLLFLNDANRLVVQTVNANGSLVGAAMVLPALHKATDSIADAYPAYGAWLVTWSPEDNYSKLSFSVFGADGKSVLLQPITVGGYQQVERLSDDLFLFDSDKALQLLDLSNKPAFSTIYNK